jgi:hypothetical protein
MRTPDSLHDVASYRVAGYAARRRPPIHKSPARSPRRASPSTGDPRRSRPLRLRARSSPDGSAEPGLEMRDIPRATVILGFDHAIWASQPASEKPPQLIELRGLSVTGSPDRMLSEPPRRSCTHLRRRNVDLRSRPSRPPSVRHSPSASFRRRSEGRSRPSDTAGGYSVVIFNRVLRDLCIRHSDPGVRRLEDTLVTGHPTRWPRQLSA